MKKINLLFLPMLLALTSCVSIGQSPVGSEFVPNESQTSEKTLEFEDGPQISIDTSLTKSSISFRNDNDKAIKEYSDTNKDELLADTTGNKELIQNFENIKNCFYGNFGLKINYQGKQENNLGIKLTKSVRYVELITSPAFLNKLDYQTGNITFVSNDSAINVNDSKYIKLEGKQEEASDKAKTYNAIFDLGEKGNNLINIHCELYSTVIYEINLYY